MSISGFLQQKPPAMPFPLPKIHNSCLGESESGKTALHTAMSLKLENHYLTSGHFIGHGNLRKHNHKHQENELACGQLREGSLISTQRAAVHELGIFDPQANPCIEFIHTDSVGQVTTDAHTMTDSTMQQVVNDQMDTFRATDVITVIIPMLEAEASKADHKEWRDNLQSKVAYLHQVCLERGPKNPMSVQIAITKADLAFDNPETLVQSLTAEAVIAFDPFVQLCRRSPAILEGAITATSSKGFDGMNAHSTSQFPWSGNGTDELAPWNVETVFLWALLAASLQPKVKDDNEQSTIRNHLNKALLTELREQSCWFIPLKGQIVTRRQG